MYHSAMPQSACRCRACGERDTIAGFSTTILDLTLADADADDEDVDAADDEDEGVDEDEADDVGDAVAVAGSLVARCRAIASSMAATFAL
jgi:hypothetical protein